MGMKLAAVIRPDPSGGFINTQVVQSLTNALAADVWKIITAIFLIGLLAIGLGKWSKLAVKIGMGMVGTSFALAIGVVVGPPLLDKASNWIGALFS